MTRMLSPVCEASCSRTCLAGLGVESNVDLRAASCLVLIDVRGPRRLPPLHADPPSDSSMTNDDVVTSSTVTSSVVTSSCLASCSIRSSVTNSHSLTSWPGGGRDRRA